MKEGTAERTEIDERPNTVMEGTVVPTTLDERPRMLIIHDEMKDAADREVQRDTHIILERPEEAIGTETHDYIHMEEKRMPEEAILERTEGAKITKQIQPRAGWEEKSPACLSQERHLKGLQR